MKIKNVKVTMSYVGLTAGDTPREVSYMPLAKIWHSCKYPWLIFVV